MNSAKEIKTFVEAQNATLVAVTKTRTLVEIQSIYDLGIRNFGENRVQELLSKYEMLPKDIHWHMIGHLQKNKVKYIAPFISLIHAVDSVNLIREINKEALKNNRIIPILLQIKVAQEDSKFGIIPSQLDDFINEVQYNKYKNIEYHGVMGMASFTDNTDQVSEEFLNLKKHFMYLKTHYFESNQKFETLSMGMSSDYKLAIQTGSNMVRIGSALFK